MPDVIAIIDNHNVSLYTKEYNTAAKCWNFCYRFVGDTELILSMNIHKAWMFLFNREKLCLL